MSNHNYYFINILFIITIYNSNIPDMLVDGNLYVMNRLEASTIISDKLFCNGNNIELNNLNFLGNICLIGNDNYLTNITINNLNLSTQNNNFLMIDPDSNFLYIGDNQSPDPTPTTTDIQFLDTNQIFNTNDYLNINPVSGTTTVISNTISLNTNGISFFGPIKSNTNQLIFNCDLALNSPSILNNLNTTNIEFNLNQKTFNTESINFLQPMTIKSYNPFVGIVIGIGFDDTLTCNGQVSIGSKTDQIHMGAEAIPIEKIINIKNLSESDFIYSYLVSDNNIKLYQNNLIQSTINYPNDTMILDPNSNTLIASSIGLYSQAGIELINVQSIANYCNDFIVDTIKINNFSFRTIGMENNFNIDNCMINNISNTSESLNFFNSNNPIIIDNIVNENNVINFSSNNIIIPNVIIYDQLLPKSYFLTLDSNNNISIASPEIIMNNMRDDFKIINSIEKIIITNNNLLEEALNKIIKKRDIFKKIKQKLENIIVELEI